MALAIGMLMGCGGDSGSGSAASTPEALRASIPEHGEDPGPQAESTYVARVGDSEALIAVVANDGAAVAYVCDGKAASEWFLGSANDGELRLDGEKGGSIDAALVGTGVQGELTHAGNGYSFAGAKAVERESGIYRSVDGDGDERIVSGWIFLDGELRGADEDSAKSVVGNISLGGVDTGTGSGTGLPPPVPSPPAPVPSCGDLWCVHERTRCLILHLDESKPRATVKERKQLESMIKSAQAKLANTGSNLRDGNCIGTSSCAGTGYDSVSDTPDC